MFFPGGIYLFKGNDGSTRKMCEICSKLNIKNQNDAIVSSECVDITLKPTGKRFIGF